MKGRLVQRQQLTATNRAAMLALLDAHFEGVTAAQFEADLSGKNWVLLVERGHALVGFSTLLIFETTVEDELLTILYSGDTIVAREAWGSAAFPRAWISAVYDLRRHYPTGRLIWLLLTSGFRTYRFLPVFWQQYYPRLGAAMPARWRRMRDVLATQLFGGAYDAEVGIVRLPQPQRLRDGLCHVPAARALDPHVALFLSLNPGHADGDELVCLADLAPEHLTAAGRRVVYGAAR